MATTPPTNNNFPMAIRFPPSQNEFDEESGKIIITRNLAVHAYATTNQKQNINEIHQNRMKELRKELEYLKETEWKYEPVEKYIGQLH